MARRKERQRQRLDHCWVSWLGSESCSEISCRVSDSEVAPSSDSQTTMSSPMVLSPVTPAVPVSCGVSSRGASRLSLAPTRGFLPQQTAMACTEDFLFLIIVEMKPATRDFRTLLGSGLGPGIKRTRTDNVDVTSASRVLPTWCRSCENTSACVPSLPYVYVLRLPSFLQARQGKASSVRSS